LPRVVDRLGARFAGQLANVCARLRDVAASRVGPIHRLVELGLARLPNLLELGAEHTETGTQTLHVLGWRAPAREVEPASTASGLLPALRRVGARKLRMFRERLKR